MKLNKFLSSILTYTPPKDYNFILSQYQPENTQESNSYEVNSEKFKKVFPTLSVNLEYIKIKYNLLINSDIILREFTLNARGKQYSAFLIYIDGMVDSEIMDKFVLEPLMMRNKNNLYDGSQNKVVSEAVTNNITVRKVKKFDLASYVMSCLMPQNSVKEVTLFEEAISGINSRKLCSFYRHTKSSIWYWCKRF